MGRHAKAIYYALDDNPRYLFFARTSIRSLRRYNKELPVHLFVYGSTPAGDRAFFAQHRVELHEQPPEERPRLTFLKWLSLTSLSEERLLFVDADTFFFQDPELLFARSQRFDFYAREEIATREAQEYPHLIGNSLVLPQMDHEIYDALVEGLGGKKLPIFNTGVMLMNRGIGRELARGLSHFEELRSMFRAREIPYPSTNWHIVDEIVASLVLGCISGLSCGLIPPRLSPFYLEWKGGAVPEPGALMHVWSLYYPFFLRDFLGRRATAAFKALSSEKAGRQGG